MSRRLLWACVAVLTAATATALMMSGAATGKTSKIGAAEALPSSSCGPVFYKGSGKPQYIIATDLPLSGCRPGAEPGDADRRFSSCSRSSTTSRPASTRRLPGLRRLDRADRCLGSGQVLVERHGPTRLTSTLIGVLGTFNSGCAKLIVPILNRAPGGAVAMVSSANTNVGLTHTAPWNSPGEPGIYYPTG